MDTEVSYVLFDADKGIPIVVDHVSHRPSDILASAHFSLHFPCYLVSARLSLGVEIHIYIYIYTFGIPLGQLTVSRVNASN